MLLDGIDYEACGYCGNEEICKIKEAYIKSGKRKTGDTAELAKKCGHYSLDSKCHWHDWRLQMGLR